MDYIILDLEWNQPLSYNSSAYKSVGGKLLFEMIQIGAIKLNDRLEIIDTFNQLIQPTHYVKLHQPGSAVRRAAVLRGRAALPFLVRQGLRAAHLGL